MSALYQSLPEGGSHIRLLRVSARPEAAQAYGGEPVIPATLLITDLNNNGEESIEFTAVSYTWDHSPNRAHLRLPDGTLLSLSQTIYDLVTALQQGQQKRVDRENTRHIKSTITLWVDALCINQQDVTERAAQVNMMGRIYSSASDVIVWLGKPTPDADAAFHFMNSVALASQASSGAAWEQLVTLDATVVQEGLRATLATLAYSWFHRTWVIQEVALGQAVTFVCGSHMIDLATFMDCIWAIPDYLPIWDLYEHDDDPAVLGLYSAERTLGIRHIYQAEGAVPLELLLQAALFVGATDQRDLVHGFRGICGAEARAWLPEPDYKISVHNGDPAYHESVDFVFRETSAGLLCNSELLDALALSGVSRPRRAGFPTWGVYVQRGDESNTPISWGNWEWKWDAGGPLQTRPTRVSTSQIRIHGKVLDQIKHLCEAFDHCEDTSQQNRLITTILDSWQRTRCASRQEHLKQLASDLVLGRDEGSRDPYPELFDQFNEYISWLGRDRPSPVSTKMDMSDGSKYHQLLTTKVGGWKVFFTRTGHVGIGPPAAEDDDTVVIVPGCRYPLILRKRVQSTRVSQSSVSLEGPLSVLANSNKTEACSWIVVGWCYLRGLMRAKGSIEGNVLETEFVLE
ncbi:HET domain-containing protein [Microdochium nivale]|nr:HET domain-containing protein [Microdochium nivale]